VAAQKEERRALEKTSIISENTCIIRSKMLLEVQILKALLLKSQIQRTTFIRH
jgi:hypothetical protein